MSLNCFVAPQTNIYYFIRIFRSRGPDAEGAELSGALWCEGQGHRASRAEVLGVDRWLHRVVAVDVPADVDLQARVR